MSSSSTPAGADEAGGAAGPGIRLTPVRQAKLFFFAAAGISFLLSVSLWFSGDQERGMFVGLWVPSICSAGALLLAGGGRP